MKEIKMLVDNDMWEYKPMTDEEEPTRSVYFLNGHAFSQINVLNLQQHKPVLGDVYAAFELGTDKFLFKAKITTDDSHLCEFVKLPESEW